MDIEDIDITKKEKPFPGHRKRAKKISLKKNLQQEQENILLSGSEEQTKQTHCWTHSQHTQEKERND